MTDDVRRNGVFTGYERLFKKKANRRENLVFQLLLNLVIDAVNMKMILTVYNITSNTRIYINQYDFNIVVFNSKNKINGQPFDL
jgi:hypothetical protein